MLMSGKEKRRGISAISQTLYFKIRALVNDKGQKVDKAIPSTPIEVLGLSNAPEAGEKFIVVENDKIAKKIVELAESRKGNVLSSTNSKASFDDLLKTQIDSYKPPSFDELHEQDSLKAQEY